MRTHSATLATRHVREYLATLALGVGTRSRGHPGFVTATHTFKLASRLLANRRQRLALGHNVRTRILRSCPRSCSASQACRSRSPTSICLRERLQPLRPQTSARRFSSYRSASPPASVRNCSSADTSSSSPCAWLTAAYGPGLWRARCSSSAHLDEGAAGVILNATFGAMFSLPARNRSSLRPGIMAHAWHDALSGPRLILP